MRELGLLLYGELDALGLMWGLREGGDDVHLEMVVKKSHSQSVDDDLEVINGSGCWFVNSIYGDSTALWSCAACIGARNPRKLKEGACDVGNSA